MSSLSTSTLIIGANRGIGLGLVIEALKVQPNATIYATARSVEKATALQELKKQHGDRLVLLEVDMIDEASVEKAAATLKSHTSTLELLIVNAGQSLGNGPITALTSKDFLENINTNVVGPHNLVKAFSPFLLASKNKKKTIALIGSLVGSVTILPSVNNMMKQMFKTDSNPISGYSTTKTALNMLGRQWGEYLEPQGVAVVLIHPGAVATDMNKGEGTITVAESATKVIQVIEKLDIADTSRGILSYDGSTIPW